MGLFGEKKNPAPPTEEIAQPKNQPNAAPEITGMSGFASISEVKKAAEKDSAPELQFAETRPARRSKQSQEAARLAKEAEEKQRRKEIAMQRTGRHLMSKLAAVPYDFWAKFAHDDALKLTPQEHKELTEDYILLVQGFDVDFSSPWFMIFGLAASHAVLVQSRLEHLSSKAKTDDSNWSETKAEATALYNDIRESEE